MLSRDRSDNIKTTSCVHRFSYFFTASDHSEGTAEVLVSPCSNMMHHGFRSKEVRHTRKQNIDCTKQHHTPHCWLPVKVMCPANSTKRFSWLTRSTPIFIVEEHSNIYSLCIKLDSRYNGASWKYNQQNLQKHCFLHLHCNKVFVHLN